MDVAHEQTNKEIQRLEKRLAKEYKQAEKELRKKTKEYFKKFEAQDKQKNRAVKSGKLSKAEYIEWRTNKMLYGETLKQKVNVMADYMVAADRQAANIINKSLPETYANNYNYAVYQIEKGKKIKTSFTLHDNKSVERLAHKNPKMLPYQHIKGTKAHSWSKRKINSAITQGILQGESLKDVAKRLDKVAEMGWRSAVRNARTAMTGAQNGGRLDSYDDAKRMGIGLKKRWMATLDDRTRKSHQKMDGEIAETEEPFSNDLMFPGDAGGKPAEVYNCRCTMVAVLDDFTPQNFERYDNINGVPIEYVTYEQWKQARTGETIAKAVSEQVVVQTANPRTAQYINNITEVGGKNDTLAKGKVDSALQSFADSLGESVEEAIAKLETGIKRIIDESDFIMHIRGHNLSKVLDDGYFKNQFETGSSGGAFAPSRRKELENRKFGVPIEGIEDADRPVYGMFAPKFDVDNSDIVYYYEDGVGSWYGDVVVVLKKENVINNATMTIGDSLDYDTHLLSTEVNNIHYAGSYRNRGLERIASITEDTPANEVAEKMIRYTNGSCDGYFEYQLHGKETHSIDNIQQVIIPHDSYTYYDELRKKLDKMGIKWILSRKT